MYIEREIEKLIKKTSDQFCAVALTGPRQTGKSTLLKRLFRATHKYVTLDDPLMRESAVTDPKMFLESLGERMIIDEIQYAPQLTSYIKIAIDEKHDQKGRYILTGSQQYHLIKNLGDSLAGRVAIFELLPFNCTEKQKISFFKKKCKTIKEMFIDSCLRGSFPEPCINLKMDISQWMSNYFQTYLERDLRSVFDIGNLRDFQRFTQLLASRCSQILNLTSLAADIGIAVNTAKRWISVLEASRIIYLLYPYYNNLGKRIVKSPKVYFLDTGLVCYLTGIRDSEILMKGSSAGALFENFCIQETVKKIFNYKKNIQLYYLRTNNALEVDLLIENNAELFPCEIKLNMTPRIQDASNIIKIKQIFNKLPIKTGRLISLSDTTCSLGQDLLSVTFEDYYKWL